MPTQKERESVMHSAAGAPVKRVSGRCLQLWPAAVCRCTRVGGATGALPRTWACGLTRPSAVTISSKSIESQDSPNWGER